MLPHFFAGLLIGSIATFGVIFLFCARWINTSHRRLMEIGDDTADQVRIADALHDTRSEGADADTGEASFVHNGGGL